MASMDLKRCPYCVSPLVTLPLDPEDGSEIPAWAVICRRCDGNPGDEELLFLPAGWE